MGPRDWFGYASRKRLRPREIVSLGGTVDPFGEAAEKLIRKMCGLRVSGIDGAACHGGRRCRHRNQRCLRAERCIRRPRPGSGTTRMRRGPRRSPMFRWTRRVLSIQGNQGAEAEGRMINIGMVYNPDSRGRRRDGVPVLSRFAHPGKRGMLTSMSGLGGLAQYRYASKVAQVGMDRAERAGSRSAMAETGWRSSLESQLSPMWTR